ncbi:hypothetical protein AVEN_52879-1 [Araneus ventricosus]|uniref:Uncharacterized protein n=1 Tax=Araneus ventricosus TaxID=182803 RepID=A0A4Y2RMP5_ARAVE|nr:hypothetical protein AVEN_52879-1 [Araneus ventricosus]
MEKRKETPRLTTKTREEKFKRRDNGATYLNRKIKSDPSKSESREANLLKNTCASRFSPPRMPRELNKCEKSTSAEDSIKFLIGLCRQRSNYWFDSSKITVLHGA